MPQSETLKLIVRTRGGTLVKMPVDIVRDKGRIKFLNAPFALKDEIKAMQGSKWHGYDEPPEKVWSVKDSFRNHFQLEWMQGRNPYEWFERPIIKHNYDRPLKAHQFIMSDIMLTYHYGIIAAEMGLGKGQSPSAKVATPTGWTTFGEIKVGDTVINPEGGTTTVKGVYKRGRMEMFRVSFSDGVSVICSGDHLWNVQSACQKNRGKGFKTIELNTIVLQGLQQPNGNAKFYIPMVAPVEYVNREFPIPAYLIGYLLGNGCFRHGCTVSIPDDETVERLNSMMSIPLHRKPDSIEYTIKDTDVKQWVTSTHLQGLYSFEKHIPDNYLFGSLQDRLELFQGLCDSDGTPHKDAGVEFTTTSVCLRDTFVALVHSFGGTCHLHECTNGYTHNGEKRTGRLAYRIQIALPAGIQPFKLGRKAEKYVTPTKYQPTRAIISIDSVGEDECICIAVEAANQLYVTDDYIVTHNTLSAIECIEKSGFTDWWWAAPKSGLAAVEREFVKWGIKFLPKLMTYDRLRIEMEQWEGGAPAPRGIICDESSRLKSESAKRTRAVQGVADAIRAEYGYKGFCIEMSGSPSPKSPLDWWSQVEIACPGFLREGCTKSFEWRLGIFKKQKSEQGEFNKRVTWKDNPEKCNVCGKFQDDPEHEDELFGGGHKFVPSIDEVSLLKERLKGIAWTFSKEEWLKELPEMIFREVRLEPSSTTKRVAKALAQAAPTAIQGLTWLRELSDGFQYREKQDGMKECPCCRGSGECEAWEVDGNIVRNEKDLILFDEAIREGHPIKQILATCDVCEGAKTVPNMVRETKMVPTPKDDAMKDLLEENEDQGRLVIFAGFQGSVDRVTKLCLDQKWDVLQVDGRGWKIILPDGRIADRKEKVLDHWADMSNHRVAFVAHPASGGLGLTLTEARMAVFYSNDYSPESRTQAMARIHRLGMDTNLGATIVDLFHLPTDEKVLNVLKANRSLEKMTLDEFRSMV